MDHPHLVTVYDAGFEGETLYLHRIIAPSLGFYAGRVPVYVPSRSLMVRLVDDGRSASVVLEERRGRAVRASAWVRPSKGGCPPLFGGHRAGS